MTNKECRKKYPIGTRIKYIEPDPTSQAAKDVGKVGRIVGYHGMDWPLIFLPESEHISCLSTLLVPATWAMGWGSIEILSQKNQQLLFSFME